MAHNHGTSQPKTNTAATRISLIGSPNCGKSTIFNSLTGLKVKTANYAGVTVDRAFGHLKIDGQEFLVEDLPGTYSLVPISPDESVVVNSLLGKNSANGYEQPQALVAVIDVTALERSLNLLSEILQLQLPTCVVLTMTDELARRSGSIDAQKLSKALGIPVISAVAHQNIGIDQLRQILPNWQSWETPIVTPPTQTTDLKIWSKSILDASGYQAARQDERTNKLDSVILHPVWGAIFFFAVMFAFFEAIFTLATPLQDGLTAAFSQLSELIKQSLPAGWLGSFIGDGLVGGVGSVLVFTPQIAIMFLFLALLEGVGYLARAAFLMDSVMAKVGLEGRAFISLLSSVACAVPGIMSTRSMPSAKDRIATMMAAPLMTCSARLPVYVLLVGMLVPGSAHFGPFQLQGVVMFALYLLGALSAMAAAGIVSALQTRKQRVIPFYMEMPPYRIPTLRNIVLTTWSSVATFLRKAGTIILAASALMWLLLNISFGTAAPNTDVSSPANNINNSVAASIGKGLNPVFEPLGFNWKINVGVVASLTARETFVSTMGQLASSASTSHSPTVFRQMTYITDSGETKKVFTPSNLVALLVFFMFALQCMSTIAVMYRESGSWRWPAIAFGYMFALAWFGGYLGRTIVQALGFA